MQTHEKNLIEFSFFYDRYIDILENSDPRPTQKAAYEVVEEEFESFFGRRKYASFHSFYNVYKRKLKG
jgi:hypothetical protein